MAEEKKNIPKLRFREFTGDNANAWELRKLGEVARIVGGGTPKTSIPEYWNGEINWYSPVEIGKQTYVYSSQKKITELGLKKSSAKILPVGTILFTSRAGIGNTAILSKEATTNQGFQSIVPDSIKLDSYFIYSRSSELKKYGEKNGAGSTFIEVSGKEMEKMPIYLPKLIEQQKIGSFFKHLDELITLHQRMLDEYKTLKKTMLSKMFPKNGEKYPELRFSGFTDAWELRKLGDIGKITAGGDIDKNEITSSGKYPVIANGLTNDGVIGYYNNYYRISGPAVTVTGRGDIGLAKAREFDFTPVVRLLAIETKQNVIFLENSINRLQFFVESTGVPQLTAVQLRAYKIYLTTTIEQQKIGSFFRHLDELITLHQRRGKISNNIKNWDSHEYLLDHSL